VRTGEDIHFSYSLGEGRKEGGCDYKTVAQRLKRTIKHQKTSKREAQYKGKDRFHNYSDPKGRVLWNGVALDGVEKSPFPMTAANLPAAYVGTHDIYASKK